jgi:p-aminobenzoyl-glutamate transporter AbgT
MNRDTGPLTDEAAGVAGILNRIERLGNSLPHPATLFAALALGVVLLSGLAGALGWSAIHPITGAEVKAVKAGDKVLINGFSGSDVEFADGELGKFITVDDVIAIIS